MKSVWFWTFQSLTKQLFYRTSVNDFWWKLYTWKANAISKNEWPSQPHLHSSTEDIPPITCNKLSPTPRHLNLISTKPHSPLLTYKKYPLTQNHLKFTSTHSIHPLHTFTYPNHPKQTSSNLLPPKSYLDAQFSWIIFIHILKDSTIWS